MKTIEGKNVTIGYGDTTIIDSLDVAIPKGKVTVLIGGNGCGKSTLLRSLSRLLKPDAGQIILEGADISKMRTKEIAKKMAVLPQSPTAPEGLTVLQLVKQGRYPYQSWAKQWSKKDEEAVTKALEAANMADFQDRPVDSLSGGQRQRAWIAMILAQNTETLFLDEPTTYLDMTHQIDILDLLFDLNKQNGRTIVMVLHDLNLACRYADHIIAIKDKTIYSQGKPEDIISCDLVRNVFQMECQVTEDPLFGTPLCIPYGKGRCLFNKMDDKHEKSPVKIG
ncbi:ABC transporter ATP-binding protein [Alteribacillus sp. YIM 98480]|uniref:ABC transporter ATP-binding protein n=1 Tax=Alteribacillus sp. YIM 98480 TaxID=2606599 RepID=UPI00131C5906|nr:ABC transporter ATP-binding protein [Alteribacillus sp. YIM 98480]